MRLNEAFRGPAIGITVSGARGPMGDITPALQSLADAAEDSAAASAASASAASTTLASATTQANRAETEADAAAASVASLGAQQSGADIHFRALAAPGVPFQTIWDEYNKPVWHLGNQVIVDVTGAPVQTTEQELVFTLKLTAANQTFTLPTRNTATPEGQYFTIDWGDGTVADYATNVVSHAYVGAIGAQFQVRLKGVIKYFDFSPTNAARNVSGPMLKSIDKNTLPKTTPFFDLSNCVNVTYLCRGAFSSWTGTSFNTKLPVVMPNAVLDKDVFVGSGQLTNINALFENVSTGTADIALPVGVFDPLVNVTLAVGTFRNRYLPLPAGLLAKMPALANVNTMFFGARFAAIDNRIFINQNALTEVGQCFRLASNLVADANQLYLDMSEGAPSVVNGCFANVPLMTNLASVPAPWKTL